jgi:hypothetical protein
VRLFSIREGREGLAHARVSTVAQDPASQLAQLKAAGCEKVFRQKITGTTADRPQLSFGIDWRAAKHARYRLGGRRRDAHHGLHLSCRLHPVVCDGAGRLDSFRGE